MELKNGRVYFSSASDWNALLKWLKKKGKRPTNEPWFTEFRSDVSNACLVQVVEDIPKNPQKPKFYSCVIGEFNTHRI